TLTSSARRIGPSGISATNGTVPSAVWICIFVSPIAVIGRRLARRSKPSMTSTAASTRGRVDASVAAMSSKRGRPSDADREAVDVSALGFVDAPTAARTLGVTVETLYTYVSRRWIRRVARPDGRGHLYVRVDVDRLKAKRQGRKGEAPAAG